MKRERNGWEHHELEKEMAGANTAQLLAMYARESTAYNNACVSFLRLANQDNDERRAVENHCQFLDEGRTRIALTIADILTDTGRSAERR